MAYVHAYDGWLDAKKEGTAMDYCWNNFLSPQTLEAMQSLRKQFKDLIGESGFLNGVANENNDYKAFGVLGGVICSGLFPRVAAVLVRFFTLKMH
jgi:ATP-dependent RNA helicase DHX36